VDGVHEGPNVEFAQDSVRYIRAHGLAVQLLFVGDEVLGCGLDSGFLHAFDCLSHHDALEIRVGAKAFPVTSALSVLAERSGCGA
jgi:hypothetical protein